MLAFARASAGRKPKPGLRPAFFSPKWAGTGNYCHLSSIIHGTFTYAILTPRCALYYAAIEVHIGFDAADWLGGAAG